MSEHKVIVLVACHKPDTVYEDEVYTPIHVGRALSKYKDEMSNMIGDDTGDNISQKNPWYSELTAQYWAWKNLKCEYIGLCHYRRYFETKIDEPYINSISAKNVDVVLIKRLHSKKCIGNKLIYSSCMEDVYIFTEVFRKLYPDKYHSFIKYLGRNQFSPYNMFLMRKSLFDDFANFQFKLLFEVEKYFRPSGYNRMKRVLGYLSECLLSFFVEQNHLNVKYERMSPNVNAEAKDATLWANFVNDVKHLLCDRKFSIEGKRAVEVGLANDGINIGEEI